MASTHPDEDEKNGGRGQGREKLPNRQNQGGSQNRQTARDYGGRYDDRSYNQGQFEGYQRGSDQGVYDRNDDGRMRDGGFDGRGRGRRGGYRGRGGGYYDSGGSQEYQGYQPEGGGRHSGEDGQYQGRGVYGNQRSNWKWQDSRQDQRGRGQGRGGGGGRGRGRNNQRDDQMGTREFDNTGEGNSGNYSGRRNYGDDYDERRDTGRSQDQSEGYGNGGKSGGRQRSRGNGGRGRGKLYQSDDSHSDQQFASREYGNDYRGNEPERYQSRGRNVPEPNRNNSRGYLNEDSSSRGNRRYQQDNKERGVDRVDQLTSHIRGTKWQSEKSDQDGGRDDGKGSRRGSGGMGARQAGEEGQKGKRGAGGWQTGGSQQKGARRPYPKKGSKAGSAETQTGSLIEQLMAGSYECPVCCDRIKCEARVWSCKTCYVVFHLGCIKKWAKTPAATAEGTDGWQCPACRGVETKIPHVYFCFCGKLREPPWEPGETPHSCGEVCRRKRPTSCPHPCNILCHPGPCPPCPSNVQKYCKCGKSQQTVRCGSQNEIRCQAECGRPLNCGRHACQEICHEGSCSACQEMIVQECYCGQGTREVECNQDTASVEPAACYSCMTPCDKLLDCGQHRCEDPCHPDGCKPCALDPSRVTHCPCGKTPLSSLGGAERTKCTDPVPTCDNKCQKLFPCGGKDNHQCEQPCHSGPCAPCEQTSNIKCRCGLRFVDVPCKQITESVKSERGFKEVLCDRKCTKKKHCGRHKCGLICCVDTEHMCYQLCGRKLKCGIHACEEPCHVGNCPPCLYASFEELTCHCGTEVLYPPISCGTPPPECRQPCNRRHSCSHAIRHNCHSDEKCPPCVELTSKTCIGGHEVRYNIPCHVQGISCGRPCGKPLPCGYHTCRKTCHIGECDPECKQPCKVPRPDCGHQCNVTCHLGWPCPQITCKIKVTVKCPCGRRSQVMECQASGSEGLNKAMQKLTVSKLVGKIQTLQRNEEVDISELTGAKGSNKASRLLCDEECALQERNKRLAVALQIKNPDLSPTNKTTLYSDFLKEQARKHSGFVSAIEKELAALIMSAQNSKQASRSHAFPSMIKNHRRIIHELAEFYGCESESYDEEPKRNVVTTARKNRCFMPTTTLTSVIQRELNPRAPLPIPHASQEDDIRSAAKAVKLSTDVVTASNKPNAKVIDYFDMTG